MKKKWSPLSIVFLSLAMFGLIYQLIKDTKGFFLNIFITVIVIAMFIGIYHYLTNKQGTTHRYPHPPKQKNNTYSFSKTKMTSSSTKSSRLKMVKKNKEYPFKVIEGNKGKKNKPYSS